MGTEGEHRGATPLGAVLLMALAAFLCGCSNPARAKSNEARVEARPADASPGVQDLIAEGLRQHQAGNAKGAIEKYKAALAAWDGRDPGEKAIVLVFLATEYLDIGRWQEAIEASKEAITIRPDYEGAYLTLGRAYKSLSRLQEAIEALRRATQLKPDFAEAYAILGLTYTSQSRFEDAISSYEHAIRINPNVAEMHNDLGVLYGWLGRHEDAIAAWEGGLFFLGTTAGPFTVFVATRRRSRTSTSASAAPASRAIRIKPDYVEAQFSLGLAYLALGRAEQALEPLRQTVRLKPDSAEAQDSLGLALMQVGSSQEAVDTFRQATKIKPDYAEAYLNLGMAYSDLGRIEESLEASAEALRLKPELAKLSPWAAEFRATGAPEKPTDAVVFYNRQRQAANERGDVNAEAAAALGLADAYDALGQQAEAQRYFKQALNVYRAAGNIRGQAQTLVGLGQIYQDMGQYDRALRSYHGAAVRYRDTSDKKGGTEALTKLGDVYGLVGDPDPAIQWYLLALESSKDADDMENELHALMGITESAAAAGNQQLAERYRADVERVFHALLATPRKLFRSKSFRMAVRREAKWGNPEHAIVLLKLQVALDQAISPKTRRFRRETALDLYFL
jgi:tetratricopeptide (TPR) repeat protein